MKNFLFLVAITVGFAFGMPQYSSLQAQDPVTFTLRNGSMESIPLKIPGVMNPNLSPMSNSGVILDVGQKIFFSYKGKKELLLLVTSDLEGQTLLVNKLIKKRKAELDSI
ncbi:MAG: hypothetical protein KDC34_02230 [Saprospiraceae bacterium]|nr:hypothetical protein [Saprospiraceae bacterium]